MEKKMDNEMETLGPFEGVYRDIMLQQVAPRSSFEPHDSGIQRLCSSADVRFPHLPGCPYNGKSSGKENGQ